ncbi:uncharacterized protein LOC123559999 isoform X2 [Mercenaria mercenaria]|uniref:uncharacterized protein LOC123559999 isoform X2 n=1 Tax=Mercenaria mercenaria TaxID=6596 RepID=UPI00234EB9B8|nr:uncharacterized protein LOC123559999 isoform X2 [Mercenaria mercenaria]
MKKLSSRRKLLTTVCRMCYTSTFGLFVFTILNDYSSANNETVIANPGNSTNLGYHVLPLNTWFSGFNECKNVHNLTMASADDIDEGEYNVTSDLPVWTYAFEVTLKNSGKTFRIRSNGIYNRSNAYTCAAPNGTITIQCCTPYIMAKKKCKDGYQMDFRAPEIYPDELGALAQSLYMNLSRWAKVRNESEFLHENNILSVRCLLLDENGKLRTDDCNKQHSTFCIPGETQPVLQYVDKAKIPPYKPPRTTTPSPGRSNFWMDPQIRYSIIGVGCFIILAILTAVCCCCCRKRRKGENNKRKSAYLADAYSETADSIVMKETSVYETADTSQYAIPEDALKKARHRKSIGENEYDVLQKTKKTQQKFTGNTYNHVTLVSSKDRRGSSNQDENTYDVTNYGKQNPVIISPNDLTGNMYGEVAVKVESEVKTKR